MFVYESDLPSFSPMRPRYRPRRMRKLKARFCRLTDEQKRKAFLYIGNGKARRVPAALVPQGRYF